MSLDRSGGPIDDVETIIRDEQALLVLREVGLVVCIEEHDPNAT